MMPPANVNELQMQLRDPKQVANCRRWFNYRMTAPDLILESVSGSTFRAYSGNKKYTPSSIYRTWAKEFINDKRNISRLMRSTSEKKFRNFHIKAGDNLLNYWRKHEPSNPLQWGKSRKLLDLFFKHLILWINLPACARHNLQQFARVPLDKFTLRHIHAIANGPLRNRRNWTMGYVTNQTCYNKIQN